MPASSLIDCLHLYTSRIVATASSVAMVMIVAMAIMIGTCTTSSVLSTDVVTSKLGPLVWSMSLLVVTTLVGVVVAIET